MINPLNQTRNVLWLIEATRKEEAWRTVLASPEEIYQLSENVQLEIPLEMIRKIHANMTEFIAAPIRARRIREQFFQLAYYQSAKRIKEHKSVPSTGNPKLLAVQDKLGKSFYESPKKPRRVNWKEKFIYFMQHPEEMSPEATRLSKIIEVALHEEMKSERYPKIIRTPEARTIVQMMIDDASMREKLENALQQHQQAAQKRRLANYKVKTATTMLNDLILRIKENQPTPEELREWNRLKRELTIARMKRGIVRRRPRPKRRRRGI